MRLQDVLLNDMRICLNPAFLPQP